MHENEVDSIGLINSRNNSYSGISTTDVNMNVLATIQNSLAPVEKLV